MIYILQYLKCCFISFPLYLSSQNIQTNIMHYLLLVLTLLAGVVHGQDDCNQVKSELDYRTTVLISGRQTKVEFECGEGSIEGGTDKYLVVLGVTAWY